MTKTQTTKEPGAFYGGEWACDACPRGLVPYGGVGGDGVPFTAWSDGSGSSTCLHGGAHRYNGEARVRLNVESLRRLATIRVRPGDGAEVKWEANGVRILCLPDGQVRAEVRVQGEWRAADEYGA